MRILLVFALLGLSACGEMMGESAQPQVIPGVWVRTDGQSGRANPALANQFAADKSACQTATDVDRSCMAARGYVLVPANEAASKAAELRAKAGNMTSPPPAQPTSPSGT